MLVITGFASRGRRWAVAEVHTAAAAGDQGDRKARLAEYNLPVSTWSLAKLAEFLVAEEVVDDISHEGLRVLLREEASPFSGKDLEDLQGPRYAAKKARVERLYAIADREVTPDASGPGVVFCVDEFGPLDLQPRPGRQWAAVSGKVKEPRYAEPRPQMRNPYPHRRVRYLFAVYELGEDSCSGISSRARPRPGSGSSAGTYALCTRPAPGSRSSAVTSAGPRRPGPTPGPRRTRPVTVSGPAAPEPDPFP